MSIINQEVCICDLCGIKSTQKSGRAFYPLDLDFHYTDKDGKLRNIVVHDLCSLCHKKLVEYVLDRQAAGIVNVESYG